MFNPLAVTDFESRPYTEIFRQRTFLGKYIETMKNTDTH